MTNPTSKARALIDLDNLSVLMTTPTTNKPGHPPRYMSIRFTDETSGQLIAEVDVMPDQLVHVFGNSSAKARGRVNVNTHRLGKEHQCKTVEIDIPRESGKWGEQPGHPNVQVAIREAQDEGWESWDYRYSHGRHSLLLRRWVDVDGADDAT